MKVFISWSGSRSKHIALTFRHWLKRFSPAIEPWMSSVDIQKGFSWDSAIAKELNESKVGLICLTSDNLKSTYLHYEAGAISNVPDANVYTFLYKIKDTDVQQPLSRFQNTKFEKDDVLQLVRDINFKLQSLGETYWSAEALEENFDFLYPKLQEELDKTPEDQTPTKPPTETELLEELLRTVRGFTNGQSSDNNITHRAGSIAPKRGSLTQTLRALRSYARSKNIEYADLTTNSVELLDFIREANKPYITPLSVIDKVIDDLQTGRVS